MSFFAKTKRLLFSLLLASGLLGLAAHDDMPSENKAVAPPEGRLKDSISALPIFTPLDSFRYVDRLRPDWKAPSPHTFVNQPEDSVSPNLKNIWRNLQIMKNSNTIIAPQLAEFSKRADILFSQDSLARDLADWQSRDGVVRVTNNSMLSSDILLTSQSHEIIHGIQRVTGAQEENPGWNIYDYQASLLASEAAGLIGSYLVALEMKINGNPVYWQERERGYPGTTSMMWKHWLDVKDKKMPMAKKLEKTGMLSFYSLFERQWWLDAYNRHALSSYVAKLLDSNLTQPTNEHYSLATLKQAGYISEKFNFTAEANHIPDIRTRFGSNRLMRQAFEYIELQRLRRLCGEEDSDYLRLLERATKDQNPYLGIAPESLRVLQIAQTPEFAINDAKDAMDYFAYKKQVEMGLIPKP